MDEQHHSLATTHTDGSTYAVTKTAAPPHSWITNRHDFIATLCNLIMVSTYRFSENC